MKKDFIAPYISLAEGEKDPRNLLVAFAIARVILIEFDPTDHIEVRPLEPSNSVSNAQ
jgi:DNA repair/transcription protein MET18/MMS19